MNNYKIKAMTAPQGARLCVISDFKTLSAIFQSIKAGADYVKGATLKSVLKSMTETGGNV